MEKAVRFDGEYKPHTTIALNENLENGKIKPVSNSDHTLKRIGEVALAVLACIFVFITAGCALFWDKIEQVIWQGFSPSFDPNDSGLINQILQTSTSKEEHPAPNTPTPEEVLEKLIHKKYRPDAEGEVNGVYYYPLPPKKEGVDRPEHFMINSHPNIYFEKGGFVDMDYDDFKNQIDFLNKMNIDTSELPKIFLIEDIRSDFRSHFVAYVFDKDFKVRDKAKQLYEASKYKSRSDNVADEERCEFQSFIHNLFRKKEDLFKNELLKANLSKLQNQEEIDGIIYHTSRNPNRIKFSIPKYNEAFKNGRMTFFEIASDGSTQSILESSHRYHKWTHINSGYKFDHIKFELALLSKDNTYLTTTLNSSTSNEIEKPVYDEQIQDTLKELIKLSVDGYIGFRKEDLFQDKEYDYSKRPMIGEKRLKVSVSDYSLVTEDRNKILDALRNIYSDFEGEEEIQKFIVNEAMKHNFFLINSPYFDFKEMDDKSIAACMHYQGKDLLPSKSAKSAYLLPSNTLVFSDSDTKFTLSNQREDFERIETVIKNLKAIQPENPLLRLPEIAINKYDFNDTEVWLLKTSYESECLRDNEEEDFSKVLEKDDPELAKTFSDILIKGKYSDLAQQDLVSVADPENPEERITMLQPSILNQSESYDEEIIENAIYFIDFFKKAGNEAMAGYITKALTEAGFDLTKKNVETS